MERFNDSSYTRVMKISNCHQASRFSEQSNTTEILTPENKEIQK